MDKQDRLKKCVVLQSFIDKNTLVEHRKRDVIMVSAERFRELKNTYLALAPKDAELTMRDLKICSPCKK